MLKSVEICGHVSFSDSADPIGPHLPNLKSLDHLQQFGKYLYGACIKSISCDIKKNNSRKSNSLCWYLQEEQISG